MSDKKKEFTEEWQLHCSFLEERVKQLEKDSIDAEDQPQVIDFIQSEKSRMKNLLGFLQKIDIDKLFKK